MRNPLELYGSYGTAAIVLAYALASFYVIEATCLTFQILNGIGMLSIESVSFYKKACQRGVLNIIWTLVAAIASARDILR